VIGEESTSGNIPKVGHSEPRWGPIDVETPPKTLGGFGYMSDMQGKRMLLREHDKRDDMKVWLSQDEVDQLLRSAEGTQRELGIALGARCGLRSHEALQVTPADVVETQAGRMLRVREGKGDKYRETPVPNELGTRIETVADVRDAPPDAPLLEPTSTRTLRRWIDDAADAVDDAEPGWGHLTYHDLRRTWATALGSADVDPLIVCDWGGWNDLDTFLEHYRGTYSPEAQRRARDGVEWI
jgi:integrase